MISYIKNISHKLWLSYKGNWAAILSIVSVSIFVWGRILNQTFLGEGYMYFNSRLHLLPIHKISDLSGYDNFAKLFFQILTPFLKDNIQYYQLIGLIIAIATFILFYKILFEILKDKFIAFSSTIFFVSSYVALFEYLGAGNYQRFIQRFPNLIPIFISFYLLWKYFRSNRSMYLIYSFLVFALSILMGHFSMMLLPLFVIFPIIQILDGKYNHKKMFIRLMIIITYVSVCYILTRGSEQKPSLGIIEFLMKEDNIIEKILLQIPVISFPITLTPFIAKHYFAPIAYPFTKIVRLLLIPSAIIYLGGLILVLKNLPKYKVIYITSLFSMISVMAIYLYVDPRLNVLVNFGQDRFYLLSSIFVFIMWSLIIKAIFYKNIKVYYVFSILFLLGYVLYNYINIQRHINSTQYQSEMNKDLIIYIKQHRDIYPKKTIILLPYYLNWLAPMINEVTNRNVIAQLAVDGWEKAYRDNKEYVFIYDYYFQKDKNGNPRTYDGHIIDLTDKFRSGGKIKFIN